MTLIYASDYDGMLKIYKESVELTSAYLLEGCGKTPIAINDTIPHTRIDMRFEAQSAHNRKYLNESECCPSRLYRKENFHIF